MSKILLIALLIMAICSTIATLVAVGFVLCLILKRDNANPTGGNAECDHDNTNLIASCDSTISQEQTEVITIDSAVELDPMLQQAVDIVLTQNHASPDVLQKHLGIGYCRAALLLDQMESIGIIGPFAGANPRKILVSNVSWEYVQPQHINNKDSMPTGNYTYSSSHEYSPPTQISRGNISVISDEEMHFFLKHYYKADEIKTKVKGVSFRNADGTDRQNILAHCHAGDQLRFEKYEYLGAPAYAVHCDWGQIGNLSADLADEIAAREMPCIILGEILNVTGGYHGELFGCNIRVNIYEKY